MANLRGGCANLINSANIILIPKKPDATSISDYKPISLIHSLSKIFFKLLANKLAPVLRDIVSKCQRAFVKKRCIHDNFMHVQNLIKELHASKTTSLFLKLDISKAFDSVGWAYLARSGEIGYASRWPLPLRESSSTESLESRSHTPGVYDKGIRCRPCCSSWLLILFSVCYNWLPPMGSSAS
jgi:hypothetical protein